MRSNDQSQILAEVTTRIVGRLIDQGGDAVESALEDTLYYEQKRLKRDMYRGEEDDKRFWRDIQGQLVSAGESTRNEMLRQIVMRFANEVMGHFDPKIYALATRALPTGLAVLLNSLDPRRIVAAPKASLSLKEQVIIKGESEAVRRLAEKGTLVVVPTHLSNLDSIVLGYAFYLMGLPPLTYGAGLNLFTNKLIGYFMSNLGAYRVDRRKQSSIYKNVLKEYATVAVEMGYHSLFFPGGTRIRSGEVERSLKKGLLGTAVTAYGNNLRAAKEKPDIYVIPCTISYGLVLEAQTLIEDHLKETGKSRYIILDDEFSRPRRIAQFMSGLLKLNSRIYVTFGSPLDPFGNRVDFQGRSLDAHDRPIDISGYLRCDGELTIDTQRDRQYTNELAQNISTEFEKHNCVQSTHITAFSTFQLMRKENPDMDIYRLLRHGSGPLGFPVSDLIANMGALLERIREMSKSGTLSVDPRLEGKTPQQVLDVALKHFAAYHTRDAVKRHASRVHVDDAELIYYYHNRMAGYDLESLF
ncbi:MAG TPA: hypothetical protein EYN66_13285 [Myxococcales bacterium]|nr:hypothetical protein [Myxococcales bacterium]